MSVTSIKAVALALGVFLSLILPMHTAAAGSVVPTPFEFKQDSAASIAPQPPAEELTRVDDPIKPVELTSLLDGLSTLATLNNEQASNGQLDRLIYQKQAMHKALFLALQAGIDDSVSRYQSADSHFLAARIKTNQSRGNHSAVVRDKLTLLEKQLVVQLNQFARFYHKATLDDIPTDIILHRIDVEQRAVARHIANTQEAALEVSDTSVYHQANDVRDYVLSVLAAWKDALDFVETEAEKGQSSFKVKDWFNYQQLINRINEALPVTPKYYLAQLNIDLGRLAVSGLLLLIAILFIPLVFNSLDRLLNKVIKSDHLLQFYKGNRKGFSRTLAYAMVLMALTIFFQDPSYVRVFEELLFIVLLLWAGHIAFKIVDFFFLLKVHRANKDALSKEVVNLGMKFAKILVVFACSVVALNHFGISIAAILSTLGLGGLAFALAAKDSLSNFFGGLNIFFDDVFKQGDWIDVNGVEGDVVEIGLRSTTLRTFDNALVSVPNSEISVQQVKNWSRREVGRRIKFWLPIAITSDKDALNRALEAIREHLKDNPDISGKRDEQQKEELYVRRNKVLSARNYNGVKDTQLVYLDKVGQYSLDILVYCFSHTTSWHEWLAVKEQLILSILAILSEQGIDFAYPTQHYRDERDSAGINGEQDNEQ